MPTESTQRGVLTTTEAAEILHVSDETVKRYVLKGQLEGFKLPGGRFRIYADSVVKMMDPRAD